MNLHQVTSNTASTLLSSETAASVSAPPPESGPRSLLPEPSPLMLDGDIGAEIAAIAVQQGQAQQTLDTRAAEEQDTIEAAADAAQVATLHDEASTMRTGALESGCLQMGAGALAIASAGTSIKAGSGSWQAGIAGILKGASEGMMGGGTLADGLSKAAATDSQALATGQKALSDSAERAGDAARDGQKSAAAFVQAAIDFYREYQSTRAQAQAAALHSA